MKPITIASVFVLIILLLAESALAIPRVPSEFRGWVIVNDKYAKDGTVITVVDESGTICGSALVENGYYGPLSCEGDDASTLKDEGASVNEPLTFLIDGTILGTRDAVRWQPGQAKEVNLVQGNVTKAQLFLQSQPGPWNGISLIILSLLIVVSLWVITAATLLLINFISNRKKRRWQQVG